jgi:hypothetical protein
MAGILLGGECRPTPFKRDNMARPKESEDMIEIAISQRSLDHARHQLLGRFKRSIEEITMGHTPGDIARLISDLKALDSIKPTQT